MTAQESAGEILAEDRALHRALRAELERAGCFRPTPVRNLLRMTLAVGAVAWVYLALLRQPGGGWMLAVLALGGAAQAHCGFLAHDAYHGALTGARRLDRWLSRFLITWMAGISFDSFLRQNHARHHADCAVEPSDPEMQIEAIAFSAEQARAKTGLARWTTRNQSWLVWPLLTINSFALIAAGVVHVAGDMRRAWPDAIGIAAHATVWLVVPSLVIGPASAVAHWVLLVWASGIYLAGIFPFFHVGRHSFPSTEAAPPFRRQIEATRDMPDNWVVELYSGGNNNHVAHHLFPAMPTPRLRQARRLIRRFCREHGLAYRECGYAEATREVASHLCSVAAFAPAGRQS